MENLDISFFVLINLYFDDEDLFDITRINNILKNYDEGLYKEKYNNSDDSRKKLFDHNINILRNKLINNN